MAEGFCSKGVLKVYQTLRRFWHKLRHQLRVLRGHDRVKVWSNPPATYLHSKIFPGATYSPWLTDVRFLDVYGQVESSTLVDRYRCYELWTLIRSLGKVPGDVLEVGVWRGGTGAILAAACQHAGQERKVYLADTFEGVVKAGKHDPRYQGGEHADTSEGQVRDLAHGLGLNNVEILKGVFPEDTAHMGPEKIAFLHCDVDVYESASDVVAWVLPRLSVGGIMVFDDYGFNGCEGITRYCNELSTNPGLQFIYNLNGHAVFFKYQVV